MLKHLSEANEPLTAARLAKRLGLHADARARRLGEAPGGDGARRTGDRGAERLCHGRRRRARGRPGARPRQRRCAGDAGRRLGAPVLARADTATLMHDDTVEVLAVGVNDRGRRVARLIRRTGDAPTRIGGVYHPHLGQGGQPEDPGHWYVGASARTRLAHGARDGDNVIVEITQRPQGEEPAHGRIVEVLTDVRPSDLAARFAILRHDLPQEFPPEVLHAGEPLRPRCAARRPDGPRGSARSCRWSPSMGRMPGTSTTRCMPSACAAAAGGCRRHRRCEPLRARGHEPRCRGALARDLGVLPGPRAADAARASVQSFVLARCRRSSDWRSSATCA